MDPVSRGLTPQVILRRGLALLVLFSILIQPLAATEYTSGPHDSPDIVQSILSFFQDLFSHGPADRSPLGVVPAAGPAAPSPATGGRITAAYWFLLPNPDDDTYRLLMSEKDRIPWKNVSRIYLGFATVKDGVLTDLPSGSSPEDAARREEMRNRIQDIISLYRQNNPSGEVFITSNFGGDLDKEYLAAAKDPQKFADSVLTYLKQYDLDGYDMDWESRNIDDYSLQLQSLLSACHASFSAAGTTPRGRPYLLTHTVWPGVETATTVASLADSVDQLNLMTYGPGDTYDLADYADAYHAAGFPYEKMIGGVESEAEYPESGGHDTQESVAAKCAYVEKNNLAGLFEWRIDNDMRPDNAAPTYQVTGWMSDCLAG